MDTTSSPEVISRDIFPSGAEQWFPDYPFLPQNPEEALRFFQLGSDFHGTILIVLLTVMILLLLRMVIFGSIQDRWTNRKELKELRQHNKQVKKNLKASKQ